MPTYYLSPKPAVADAMQQGLPVSDRLQAVAEAAGYVIGEGGIQVYGDGRVVIDCDRDPSADWAQFDPVTMLTPEEIAVQEALATSITLRRKYRRARAILDEPVGATQAAVRQNVVEHRRILGELIEVLRDSGLLLDDAE